MILEPYLKRIKMKTTITLLIITSLYIGFTGCNNTSGSSILVPATNSFIDTVPGSCPSLTRDAKGNIVLSWVRQVNDSASVFCYAVSPDGGKSFKKPIVIPTSNKVKPHAENLPKVIFKPSGEIIALWGSASTNLKNKYSGSVYYAQSFDEGISWSKAKPLVTDTAGYDQRYFDVALLANGEAAIVWLDNRKEVAQEGSSLYYATTNGKEGFVNEKRINQPCCQCCRTDLYIDTKNNIHVLYRGIIQDSIRDMVHIVSTDGGNNFSRPKRIRNDNWVLNACPHTGPAMTENKKGLHFAWYTGGNKKGTFYTQSIDNGSSFIQQDSISFAGKHPQLATGSKGDIAIVWDENVKVADRFYSRIGMQTRTSDGISNKKWFLTPDTAYATYPVIAMANEKEPFVVYCQKKNDQYFVAYQLVKSK
jgi:hypothetical protein